MKTLNSNVTNHSEKNVALERKLAALIVTALYFCHCLTEAADLGPTLDQHFLFLPS